MSNYSYLREILENKVKAVAQELCLLEVWLTEEGQAALDEALSALDAFEFREV